MYLYSSTPSYTGDFTHTTGVMMSSGITISNIVFWALSNEYGQLGDHTGKLFIIKF
jgi:hypothetical protein